MIDLIPIELYTPLYFYVFFIVVFFVFLHSQFVNISKANETYFIRTLGVFSLFFTLFYMGLRPLDQEFGDMRVYANLFQYYKDGNPITSTKDPFFHLFVLNLSKLVDSESFFLICAFIYVIPLYIVSRKWFKQYWFYCFLFLLVSFSFWAYGTNGIRNGIATSFFLLAISRKKIVWQVLWILLSISFHKSMLLPTLGFILAHFYNKPGIVVKFWLFCIPLSLIGGKFFELFISTIGFDDERLSYLTTEADAGKFSSTGFRWDFLIYSGVAVFAGWYYIAKKNYTDRVYNMVFVTYVFCNAFWILIIRANFSNRFAYLSWFMMGVVIIYPLLKENILNNQYKKIGFILLAYYLFTFTLNIIL